MQGSARAHWLNLHRTLLKEKMSETRRRMCLFRSVRNAGYDDDVVLNIDVDSLPEFGVDLRREYDHERR